MIGIVGHADLTVATLEGLEGQLGVALAAAGGAGLRGVVRAGPGLPEVFARAARTAGVPLVVVLPAQGTLPVPLPEREAIAAGELIMRAEQVRLVEFDPLDHGARVRADEELISGCRRLLAVWDGSRSSSGDATAHLVAYARGLGVPVDVLWPRRASAPAARAAAARGPAAPAARAGSGAGSAGKDRYP